MVEAARDVEAEASEGVSIDSVRLSRRVHGCSLATGYMIPAGERGSNVRQAPGCPPAEVPFKIGPQFHSECDQYKQGEERDLYAGHKLRHYSRKTSQIGIPDAGWPSLGISSASRGASSWPYVLTQVHLMWR